MGYQHGIGYPGGNWNREGKWLGNEEAGETHDQDSRLATVFKDSRLATVFQGISISKCFNSSSVQTEDPNIRFLDINKEVTKSTQVHNQFPITQMVEHLANSNHQTESPLPQSKQD